MSNGDACGGECCMEEGGVDGVTGQGQVLELTTGSWVGGRTAWT